MKFKVGDKVKLTTLEKPEFYSTNWTEAAKLDLESIYTVEKVIDGNWNGVPGVAIQLEGEMLRHSDTLFKLAE